MPKQLFAKLWCTLLPLFFGLSHWFFRFGPGVGYGINYPVIMVFWFVYAIWFYYDVLEYARINYAVTIGGIKLYLPSWKYLVIPTVFLLPFAWYVYWPHNPVIQSLLYGVLVSVFSEELLTRSVFVKYYMGLFEFLCFNVISSVAFSVMHAGFVAMPASLGDYLYGHFTFSFMLGLMVYKTQRIEISMIMHALSNLIRYTIPVLVIGHCHGASVFQIAFVCLEYSILAFAAKQRTSDLSD